VPVFKVKAFSVKITPAITEYSPPLQEEVLTKKEDFPPKRSH
jgi:hypothetical protein